MATIAVAETIAHLTKGLAHVRGCLGRLGLLFSVLFLVLFSVSFFARAQAHAETIAAAAPDPMALLGAYQREALAKVLAERGLQLDPAPEGKRVAGIWVKNLDVYGEGDGRILGLFNLLHVTTREYVIEREVLLRPGDPWSDDIAAETRRRLSDGAFSSYIVVAPVKAVNQNEVVVLVVTRDLHSLRLNTDFEYQAGKFSRLRIEPSENNFAGRRKRVSAIFDMDLSRYSVGPSYYDSNISGSRWQFIAQPRLLIGRDSEQTEGSESSTTLAYPFWSLRRRWSSQIKVDHFHGTVRSFFGPNLRTYDNLATPMKELIPWQYRYRSLRVSAGVARQTGGRIIQRFGAGYLMDIRRPEVFEELFAANPESRAAFVLDVLPRSERVSAPYVNYFVFTPRYMVFRDIETFDLPEDVLLGPQLSVGALWALPALGSERDFVSLNASIEYNEQWGDKGLFKFEAKGEGRANLSDNNLSDLRTGAYVFVATPKIFSTGRLVLRLGADRLIENKSVRNLFLGGDTGLRGYPIGAFYGTAMFRGNVEARTVGLRVAFTRLGLAAFWDFGHVAPTFKDLVIHHDFGAGLRLLIPQLQATVIRLDWAIATQGPTAKLPGRIMAGFTQGF